MQLPERENRYGVGQFGWSVYAQTPSPVCSVQCVHVQRTSQPTLAGSLAATKGIYMQVIDNRSREFSWLTCEKRDIVRDIEAIKLSYQINAVGERIRCAARFHAFARAPIPLENVIYPILSYTYGTRMTRIQPRSRIVFHFPAYNELVIRTIPLIVYGCGWTRTVYGQPPRSRLESRLTEPLSLRRNELLENCEFVGVGVLYENGHGNSCIGMTS